MPKLAVAILMSLLSAIPASGARAAEPLPAAAAAATALSNVQQRIGAARLAALTTGDGSGLVEISAQLRAINQHPSGQLAHYVPYWLAYSDYWLAGVQLKAQKRPEATATLQEAYNLLSTVPSPDADTYALLSLVAGSRIGVAAPSEIGDRIGEARDALEKAIASGPGNLRVLYARALADYTTPKEYGGGRAAEDYLRRAIDLPMEPLRPLRPTWGREECGALLVRILRASNRNDEAKQLFAKFIAQYPDSAPLRNAGQGL